jgi:circadian clock protein KaiB
MTAGDDANPGVERYELTLFVSGASALSAHAIVMAKRLFDVHAPGQYDLAVLDVHEDPDAALRHNVIATPTLLKHLPLPTGRVVGDLSDTDKVLAVLGLVVGTPRSPGVNDNAPAVPSAAR